MSNQDITLYELDDEGNPIKVTEFTGIHGATFTWNGKEYDIPVDMALSGLQAMSEMEDEEEEAP